MNLTDEAPMQKICGPDGSPSPCLAHPADQRTETSRAEEVPQATQGSRALRLASASGSVAHRRVLEELSSWKEALDGKHSGRHIQQPLSLWRPPRPLEIKRNAKASSIQRAWRRRKMALELNEGSNGDGDALLSSLRFVDGNRANQRAGVRLARANSDTEPSCSAVSPNTYCVTIPEDSPVTPTEAEHRLTPRSQHAPPKPNIAVAKAEVRRRLPQTPDGRLLPLHTELASFDRFGTDVSQYMHFVYRLARLGFWLFLLNLSNIVINFEGEELGSASSFFTIHTLGNAANNVLARGGYSYAVIEVCTALLLIGFLFSARTEFECVRDRIRCGGHGGAALTAADFTVLVHNVPEHWRAAQLRQHFERFGEVVHVGVSLDNRELILALRKMQRLKDRHIDATLHLIGLIKADAPRVIINKARQSAKRALHDLDSHRRKSKKLMSARYHCTGYAFVTFNESTTATCVVEEMAHGHAFSRVFGGGLIVQRAPEPGDVIWENLQYSPRKQLLRQALSLAVLTLLLLVSVTLLTGVNLFQSNVDFISKGLLERSFDFIPAEPSFLEFVLLQLVQNSLIIVGYVSVFVAVPLLAHLVERPHTNGEREAMMMMKLAFFNCGITITSVSVMAWVGTQANSHPDGSFKREWYPLGMSLILNTLIADVFLIQIGMDLIRPQDLLRRHLLAKRAKTQARMNELYACSAEGMLAFRLQLLIKILVLGFTFSFAMPALYLVMAVYGWLAQWVDRILFLRFLLPPPPTHERLMNVVVHFVLPGAIAVHSLLAFKLFHDICKGDHENAIAAAATATEAAASTAANLTGRMEAGVNITVFNSTACLPPPAELKACTDLTWSSARVVLGTTAILVTMFVVAYWATLTKRLQQRRAVIRSKGSVPQLLTSESSIRRFQKLYRIVAQREMRGTDGGANGTMNGAVTLSARVRATYLPPSTGTKSSLTEKSPMARAVSPPVEWNDDIVGPSCRNGYEEKDPRKSGVIDAVRSSSPHVAIRVDDGEANTLPKLSPSISASLPAECPAHATSLYTDKVLSSSIGGYARPLLLEESTLMYIPPLTRVILESFQKDMSNRPVDTFLRENTPVAFPLQALDLHGARCSQGFQAILPFLRRSPSEGNPHSELSGTQLRAEQVCDDAGGCSPASLHSGFQMSRNIVRTLPNSCRLPSMPSMPTLPSLAKPASLLQQLDAIEKVLNGRRKNCARPAVDGLDDANRTSGIGAAELEGPVLRDHAIVQAELRPSNAEGRGAACVANRVIIKQRTTEIEVAELAEAAQRLTEAAEHARHMLVCTLEHAASGDGGSDGGSFDGHSGHRLSR